MQADQESGAGSQSQLLSEAPIKLVTLHSWSKIESKGCNSWEVPPHGNRELEDKASSSNKALKVCNLFFLKLLLKIMRKCSHFSGSLLLKASLLSPSLPFPLPLHSLPLPSPPLFLPPPLPPLLSLLLPAFSPLSPLLLSVIQQICLPVLAPFQSTVLCCLPH